MKRIDWTEAEDIHPGCSAAWDQVGLVARVVFQIGRLQFCGGQLVVVVVGRRACVRHFDPRVSLWISTWWSGVDCIERASLQWFREQWCERRSERDWKWNAERDRYESRDLIRRRAARV